MAKRLAVRAAQIALSMLAAGFVYQQVGSALDRRIRSAGGRLVPVRGKTIHVRLQGHGTPPVVFESGIGASSLSWWFVQPQVAKFTATVSYDRPGLGASSGGGGKSTVADRIADLRSLLTEAGLDPPFVMVGHSFGALLVRAYAAVCPREVAGLVLVDPVSIETWAHYEEPELRRLQLGVKLCRRGVWAAQFGLVRGALWALVKGGRWFPKLAARLSGPKGTAAMTNLVGEVRKLPPEVWPIVRAHWSDPKCFRGLAEHLEQLPKAAGFAARQEPRGIPTIILSAGSANARELEERDRWVRDGGAHSRHLQIPDSGHWLHLEHPDAVIGAIREAIMTKPSRDEREG